MAAPDAAVTFSLNANAFAKCAPAVGTNLRECGTVTLCNMKPVTADDMSSVFMKSGQFRVMNALLKHDMELKMCAPVQNGLYDFIMSQKVNLSGKIQMRGEREMGSVEIIPFVLAKRYHPINNEYWIITNGSAVQVGSETPDLNWQVNVQSSTNIPPDVRSFPPGQYMFAEGLSAAGSATRTAWKVISSTISNDGTYITLVLEDMNKGAHSSIDKLGYPTTGLMVRGTNNVHDAENWCAERPAYRNWTKFPFFFQTQRNSFCWSEHYQKWRNYALQNDLYREFFDLEETEKNKQIAQDFQKSFVNMFFWNHPISNFQTAYDFDKLDPIPSFNPTDEGLTGFGVDGGRCVGYRANASGVYDQLYECGRVWDMQGGVPGISDLAILLYNMMRVREGRGSASAKKFDLFTDSVQARDLNTAFLYYYKNEGLDMVRLNVDAGNFSNMKKAEFGFSYSTYTLFWPQGVTVNVITHEFFDDWNTATQAAVTAGAAAGFAYTSRVWWILDFTGIYPGILASNRVVNKTGDLKNLAAINPSYACVMKVYTQEQTLMSMTYTVIVDCPNANAIIENIGPGVGTPGSGAPNTYVSGRVVADPVNPPIGTFGTVGSGGTTTTTTSTTTIFTNTQQTSTWTDPSGTSHTVTIPAGSYHSSYSQNMANALAADAAQAEADELSLAATAPTQTTVGP